MAEILAWMVPLMNDLGLDTHWRVIAGTNEFFSVTKAIHNGLQGYSVLLKKRDWDVYQDVNRENVKALKDELEEADIVVIHDPQPAPLLELCTRRTGALDLAVPHRCQPPVPVGMEGAQALRGEIRREHLLHVPVRPAAAPPPVPHRAEHRSAERQEHRSRRRVNSRPCVRQFDLDPDVPVLVQISRFDRFKDPVGVIEAYRMVKKMTPSSSSWRAAGPPTTRRGKRFSTR